MSYLWAPSTRKTLVSSVISWVTWKERDAEATRAGPPLRGGDSWSGAAGSVPDSHSPRWCPGCGPAFRGSRRPARCPADTLGGAGLPSAPGLPWDAGFPGRGSSRTEVTRMALQRGWGT